MNGHTTRPRSFLRTHARCGNVAIATFNTPADTRTRVKVFSVAHNHELSRDDKRLSCAVDVAIFYQIS
jgi:hypothetical protein